MKGTLFAPLRESGLLAAIDVELARALSRIAGERRDEVLLAAALASRQTREGHVCVELERFAGTAILDPDGVPIGDRRWPELGDWTRELAASDLVSDGGAATPLVLMPGGRLYLARYHEHERRLAELLKERVAPASEVLDAAALRRGLERLFGPIAAEPDGQRMAAQIAVVNRLTVVSGGPGTGKTSTVVKILALLVENALATGRAPPRIALLAPTGKAAARLGEAIARAKTELGAAPEVLASIPDAPSTIHRALGARGQGGTQFQRGPESPLLSDVVVVDESSMVDVALMRRLLEAVVPEARLILLGDEHQLASVEAGAVLGDVCRVAPAGRHSQALGQRVRAAFGETLPTAEDGVPASFADAIVRLHKSYRFSQKSAIGRLAAAIHAGDEDAVFAELAAGGETSLVEPRSTEELQQALARAARAGFSRYLAEPDPERALAELERFRFLCAHRRGPEGALTVNALVERTLADAGSIETAHRWYAKRPLLVTHNDYALGLFNGDVGIVAESADGLRAVFRTAGGLRWLSPSRLPAHETVFATSIHKSQGSELDEVAIVLPDARSPLLTRELIYTAVTRARSRVALFATREAIRAAVQRRVQRATGLTEALGGLPVLE